LTKVARVDLFLELWYDNEYRNKEHMKREYESDVSAIGEFNLFAIPCLYLKKDENGKFIRDLSECQIKDYRIHMSDPRSDPQFKNIDSLVSFMISIFKYSTFKKYIYGYYGKDVDPRPFIILALQFLKLGTKEFMRTVFPFHPLIKKYSKTYKQISKLPQELQELLYNNYNYLPKDNTKNDWMCMLPKNEISDFDFTQFYYPKRDPDLIVYKNELIIEVEELYKMIQEITRKHRFYINKMKGEEKNHPLYNLSNCTFTGFTSGVDLYYLGRTFKKTKDNKMSEISLGYFGNLHLQQITEFLATNDLYTIEQQVYDKSKCLKV